MRYQIQKKNFITSYQNILANSSELLKSIRKTKKLIKTIGTDEKITEAERVDWLSYIFSDPELKKIVDLSAALEYANNPTSQVAILNLLDNIKANLSNSKKRVNDEIIESILEIEAHTINDLESTEKTIK